MERSPCLECDLLHENKNNPTCEACGPVKQYAESMGGNTTTLPIEMTDMATKNKNRLWTQNDDDFLRENYLEMKNSQLADELNRTTNAVCIRLSVLKLRRRAAKAEKVENEPGADKPQADPAPAGLPDSVALQPFIENLPALPNKDFLIIDFSNHPELFEKLQTLASENFRPPEYQIFYLIDKAVNNAVSS